MVGPHQKAKLFTHGGSQAVRLPKAFRFEGVEVTIERTSAGVVLRPAASACTGPAFWDRIDSLRGEEELSYSTQSIIEHVPRLD